MRIEQVCCVGRIGATSSRGIGICLLFPAAYISEATRLPSDENEDRLAYVPTSVVDEIIDVAPDAEWRLLIALARYGGLRIPSEIQRMTWEHIDFANGRMTVHAPKTEHHRGKGKRVCPIFPELRPYLEDMAEIAKGKPATSFVLPNIRKISNPSTRFHDLVSLAGYESWERIFQNLRASRATDLLQAGHPIKTVSKWVGNSPEVLKAHYAQVTDSDFQKALGDTVSSATDDDDAKSPPFSPPSTGILSTSGTIRRKPEEAKRGGKSRENKEVPRWARNRKSDSIGRAGLGKPRQMLGETPSCQPLPRPLPSCFTKQIQKRS